MGITLWTQILCRINYGVKETIDPVTKALRRTCQYEDKDLGVRRLGKTRTRTRAGSWWEGKQSQHSLASPPHQAANAPKLSCEGWGGRQNWYHKSRGYPSSAFHTQNDLMRDVILGNKEWFLATIVRDPLERLLSGYMDKCVNNMKRKLEKHCEPTVRTHRFVEGVCSVLALARWADTHAGSLSVKTQTHPTPDSPFALPHTRVMQHRSAQRL